MPVPVISWNGVHGCGSCTSFETPVMERTTEKMCVGNYSFTVFIILGEELGERVAPNAGQWCHPLHCGKQNGPGERQTCSCAGSRDVSSWGCTNISMFYHTKKLSLLKEHEIERCVLTIAYQIQTHKRFKIMLFIRTKHNLQIFRVIPFMKLQNGKWWKMIKNEMESFFGVVSYVRCLEESVRFFFLLWGRVTGSGIRCTDEVQYVLQVWRRGECSVRVGGKLLSC